MAYPFESSAKNDIFELISEEGFDGLGKFWFLHWQNAALFCPERSHCK